MPDNPTCNTCRFCVATDATSPTGRKVASCRCSLEPEWVAISPYHHCSHHQPDSVETPVAEAPVAKPVVKPGKPRK
jgi:hypothetical protein